MWDVWDECIDGSISRCQNGAPVHHLNNQQLLHRNDVTLLVGRAQGSAWCYGTKGGLYFFFLCLNMGLGLAVYTWKGQEQKEYLPLLQISWI